MPDIKRLQFTTIRQNPEAILADTLVLGVYEGRNFTEPAQHVDRLVHRRLSAFLADRAFEGRSGQMMSLLGLPGIKAQEILVIGLGARDKWNRAQFRKVQNAVMEHLSRTGSRTVINTLTAITERDILTGWSIRQTVEASYQAIYRFTECLGQNSKKTSFPRLERIHLVLAGSKISETDTRSAIASGTAMAHGIFLCRNLANLPPNIATPRFLAAEARKLAQSDPRFKLKILTEREMKRIGLNALLAVAQGSHEPPRLIVLEYLGQRSSSGKPIALIGKGITFDSGGISIKPAAAMDEMKFDMCGAASVLGTLKVVSELKLPLHVVGVVAAAENMPGGGAVKPADIIHTLSGHTVEVLNTDAEGRLVLCDAITYAQNQYQPQVIIDAATLTGACVVALGHYPSGLFANNDELAHELENAAIEALDPVWRLPLWHEYQDSLKSNFADFSNVGGRDAGAITAACFLWRFISKVPWAHLDIAGTAWKSGNDKGATGRPVPLLAQYLMTRAGRKL
ncbi:MAG: leucyl aminopeptidase [Gammaproteobacteria bacterium]